jgi:hypothetical protein
MVRKRSRGATRGCRATPRGVWAVAPLFQPFTAYAARGRIFPAPARGDPAPRKPICKRDVAGAAETREMRATVDDDLLDARRGQVT